MCFYINHHNPNPIIANEDIECYKVGYRATILNTETGTETEVFESEHFEHIYLLNNKQPEILLNPQVYIIRGRVIEEGYHSYSDLDIAILSTLANQVVVKCIIPKESTYYHNTEWHEYVSTSLIVTDFLTD